MLMYVRFLRKGGHIMGVNLYPDNLINCVSKKLIGLEGCSKTEAAYPF